MVSVKCGELISVGKLKQIATKLNTLLHLATEVKIVGVKRICPVNP